jgi:hypothetical protein
VSEQPVWVWWTIGITVGLVAVWVVVVWMKGRPFSAGDVFRASRMSRGNRLLPTQVLITPTSVVQFTPGWIGKQEETIHMAHISSVKIMTGVLFSNVLIETSGGVSPIKCYGHKKGDAIRMKNLIETYQSDYYRSTGNPTTNPVAPAIPSR